MTGTMLIGSSSPGRRASACVVLAVVAVTSSLLHISDGTVLTYDVLADGSACYYEYPEAAGSCYAIGAPDASWFDAGWNCVRNGGGLMSKPTATETAVVNEIMRRENITEIWLGLTKINIPWTWTGQKGKNSPLSSLWASGEPLPDVSQADCVALDVELGYKMVARPCHQRAGYVCQAGGTTQLCQHSAVYVTEIIYHSGLCYLFMDASRDKAANVTWFEAERACAELSYRYDGRLIGRRSVARPATIDSVELYKKIYSAGPGMSHDVKRYWIGLTRARWISATGLVTDRFFMDYPEIVCVSMLPSPGLIPNYRAHRCDSSLGYVCEFDLTAVGKNAVTVGEQAATLTSATAAGAPEGNGGMDDGTAPPPAKANGTGAPLAGATESLGLRNGGDVTTPGTSGARWTSRGRSGSPTVPARRTDSAPSFRKSTTTSSGIPPTSSTPSVTSSTPSVTSSTPFVTSSTPSVTPGERCPDPPRITLYVHVTPRHVNASQNETIKAILNNITESIKATSGGACVSVVVTPVGDVRYRSTSGSDADRTLHMVLSHCDGYSPRPFADVDRRSGSFWILVCLDDPPAGFEGNAEQFDIVTRASDVTSLDHLTKEVTNYLLKPTLFTATPGHTTTNQEWEGFNTLASTNTRFLLIVILTPCAVVLLLLVVLAALVVKSKAAFHGNDSGVYLGLEDSEEKLPHHDQGIHCTSRERRPSTPTGQGRARGSADAARGPDVIEAAGRATGAPPGVRAAPKSNRSVHFAGVPGDNRGRRAPDAGPDRKPNVRRSRTGAVKLNASLCGATVYAENAPNTLFYNCWTVPPKRKT